jgi:fatty acid CoA ligase FadD9
MVDGVATANPIDPFARFKERVIEVCTREPELGARHPLPETGPQPPTTIERIAAIFARYAARPCFATRTRGDDPKAHATFEARTYAEIWDRVKKLAAGLSHSDRVAIGDRVGILGFATPDWIVADFASTYLAATIVPLQTNLSASDLEFIVQETELRCVVVSAEQWSALEAVLPRCPSVESVVLIDAFGASLRFSDPALAARIRVDAIGALEDVGRTRGEVPFVVPGRDTAEANPLMMLMYTSGSTGRPKGAMFPDRLLAQRFESAAAFAVPVLNMSYLPMSHMAGRMSLNFALVRGGTVHFTYASDMSTLLEDVRLVRPTFLVLVPHVSNTIFSHYQTELLRTGDADAVARTMRDTFLGDRLFGIWIGTAPTAPAVLQFLKDTFTVPVFDGYGSTEGGSVTFNDRINRACVTDYKLVDVPELEYSTKDRPYPRGELRVKSTTLIPGYYKKSSRSAVRITSCGSRGGTPCSSSPRASSSTPPTSKASSRRAAGTSSRSTSTETASAPTSSRSSFQTPRSRRTKGARVRSSATS